MPMETPLKEIESIVNYLWYDENKHYQERLSESLQSSDDIKHIFNELEIVRKWLEQLNIGTPKNWRDFTARLVENYCYETNSKTFTLQDLQKAKKFQIENFSKNNRHPFDKIRQQLQFLRQEGILTFLDNNGTYSLVASD